MMRSLRVVAVASCCIALISGCGGDGGASVKLVPAMGSVTYNGSPLAGATVTFMPDNGPLAIAITDVKGEFKLNSGALPGCAVGPAKVAISVATPNSGSSSSKDGAVGAPKTQEEMAAQSAKMANMTTAYQNNDANKPKSLIPDKYTDANTSGLQYTIETDSSKNNFKIELRG